MTTSIDTARAVLERHGFKLFGWGGTYRVTRDIPPYGMACPKGKGFHRDWKGFGASDVSLTWVRRLADALALADAQQVTASDCANAWGQQRKAETHWEEGASKVSKLIREVLVEEWQVWHPISETLAAIDRGRQPLGV